jgi:acylphosphatase
MVSRHLIITGRVQGVGYRDALCAEAQRRGVTGWVRNRRDGSVEALLQGRASDVDGAIAWAHHGPPAARVAQVTVAMPPATLERPYAEFQRLPTA